MTLIELLIVIAIITLLLQIALPAVEASREAARQAQCVNNLRQLTLACQLHHHTHGHFPTSGWGWTWVGHPGRGFGKDQPGGWAYNVLPYIEHDDIRDLGLGAQEGTREQQLAVLQANATPISIFNCPSRRLARTYPMVVGTKEYVTLSPLWPDECRSGDGAECRVYRSDYAINSGNRNPDAETGPHSLDDAKGWDWWFERTDDLAQNGVSHQRSMVKAAQVTDGLSKTYCIGEKFVPVADYETGLWHGDDLSIFTGHDADMNRWTADFYNELRVITPDTGEPSNQHFGSAHPTVFYMSFCDGSIRPTSFDIDPAAHRLMGGRNDGIVDSKSD